MDVFGFGNDNLMTLLSETTEFDQEVIAVQYGVIDSEISEIYLKLMDDSVVSAGRATCNLCSPIESEWVYFNSRPVQVEAKYILTIGAGVGAIAYLRWRVDVDLQVSHYCL